MRAAALIGRSIEILELPDPQLDEGRLLVAPIATGICGSDLHFREQLGELHDATPVDQQADLPPMVPGHEFAARVVEVGPGVDAHFRPGMAVTANPFTLGAEGPETIGLSPTFSGGIATLMTVDAVRTLEVPPAVPPHLAALTEPLAVGLHATRLADRQRGPNVVIGCGPVGLAVIFALRTAGRGPILAADFSAARRAAAEALGADVVIDPGAQSPYGRWSELGLKEAPMSPLLAAGAGRPAAANLFDCVGAPGLIAAAMDGAPQHSQLVVVGVCPHEDRIAPLTAIQKELTITFSFAYTMDEFAESLANIAAHPEAVAKLITSERPLAETAAAFDALAASPAEVKILIRPTD